MSYILALIISVCLISGQALWGTVIKAITKATPGITGVQLLLQVIQQPKFWLGAACYGIGTIVYFLLLSKIKFFSVQLTMTCLAVVLSTLLSHFVFGEHLSVFNIVGVFVVITGLILIMN